MFVYMYFCFVLRLVFVLYHPFVSFFVDSFLTSLFDYFVRSPLLFTFFSQVFEPFAKFWLNPLIKLIIGGEISSPGIHYMLLDIMVVLFGWSEKAIPEVTRSI